MRFLTAGESHGREMLTIIEGFPANVPIDRKKIAEILRRRRQASGRGSRMKLESDEFSVLAGMHNGTTLGSPLAVSVPNAEWRKWEAVMDPWSSSEQIQPITVPRPGHADLAGLVKYRHQEILAVAERASARETVVRTLAGCFSLQLLELLDISVTGSVLSTGGREDESALLEAQRQGDSVGGIIEVKAHGLPGGIGSYVHWDRRLDSRLAAGIMGIPAIKGVEFGRAFENTVLKGSQYHDEFVLRAGRMVRSTNRAGGIEGGMSNGESIIVRAAVKPVPTLDRPLSSFDLTTRTQCPAPISRHDLSAVGAAAVVAEAVTAWEISVSLLEQFGGDNLEDIKSRFLQYRQRWEEQLECPGK